MTRRMYDKEVHEVFDTFGIGVAIYFEAIRYRQQLHTNEEGSYLPFPLTREKIHQLTGLSVWQQYRAKKVLDVCNWIEVGKKRAKKGGTVSYFRVGDLAREALGDIKRPQLSRLRLLKNKLLMS